MTGSSRRILRQGKLEIGELSRGNKRKNAVGMGQDNWDFDRVRMIRISRIDVANLGAEGIGTEDAFLTWGTETVVWNCHNGRGRLATWFAIVLNLKFKFWKFKEQV